MKVHYYCLVGCYCYTGCGNKWFAEDVGCSIDSSSSSAESIDHHPRTGCDY